MGIFRKAFTLVELLIVITIIGILIALLLPAVQAAREAARRLQCQNNIKQLALGCLNHENIHGHLPSGGWGWGWVGDPDCGFSNRQCGGWQFNILPFIEQQSLYELGQNANNIGRRKMVQTPLNTFHCPSRRASAAYPFVHSTDFLNLARPDVIGRSDYAASAGDVCWDSWYGSGADTLSETDWQSINGTAHQATGVIFRRSECTMAEITDGSSNTYLAGERYLRADDYDSGAPCDDDQGWAVGDDFDTCRWTSYAPMQDNSTYVDNAGCNRMFGSAHATGFHMAMCDGSVRQISYSIEAVVHANFGNRKDGKAMDAQKI